MATEEYLAIVDTLYGVYLDILWGLAEAKKHIEQVQCETTSMRQSEGNKISTSELDERAFLYAHNNISGSSSYVLQHRTTQGELKRRLGDDGEDADYMANMFLVSIYQYWEDKYRYEIASDLGLCKDEIRLDVFGDLRNIRRSIIHNRSRAVADVSRNRVITEFCPGDPIVFTKEQIESIVSAVKKSVGSLVANKRINTDQQ